MMHIFQAVLVGTFIEQSGGHLLEKEERKNIKKKVWYHPSLMVFFFFCFLHWNSEVNISEYILRMKFYSTA